jgi:hypothetical protein
MKKNLLLVFAIIFLMIYPAVYNQVYSARYTGSAFTAGLVITDPTTTTITVTITKIDLPNKTITLKDQNGKIYVLTVDSTIDLSKFKVGQSATATISTTYTTDKVTKARITKTQLIKLQ